MCFVRLIHMLQLFVIHWIYGSEEGIKRHANEVQEFWFFQNVQLPVADVVHACLGLANENYIICFFFLQEATDINNLCLMYIGWGAYL